MFHPQLLILFFLYFILHLLVLAIGGKFPTHNSLVHDQTPYYPISAVKLQIFVCPFSHVNIIASIAIIVITILNIIVYELLKTSQQLEKAKFGDDEQSIQSSLGSEQNLRRFSLPSIVFTTNNFDDSNIIGKGGFGKVYKGVIDDGTVAVAIKRLNHASKQGANEFVNEIEMLSKFRHYNLISLIGYCNDSDEMILVYEYMEHGALADHLYKTRRDATLSWVRRLKICVEAARGLEYIHTGTNVIHRDMKSSNILLDENFSAKVSDFGISKVGPTDQSCSHVSTRIKGTKGYVDPEYLLTHKLTKKSDVYSFGVVLFEVLSGRPAVDLTRPEEQWGLVFWAQQCIKDETSDKITDPALNYCQIEPNSLATFVKIANHCLHYRSKKRPTMAEVVASLESALALQERTDSSIVDRNWSLMGANFGNQEITDYSLEPPEIIQSGNKLETVDKNENKTVDYSLKQQVAVHSGNGQDNNAMSTEERSGISLTKSTTIFTLINRVRKAFSNSMRKKNKSMISDVSVNRDVLISLRLNLGTIRTATGNFSDSNKLGEGEIGAVYKGLLENGLEIAVKRFFMNSRQGEREFKNKVLLLAKLQHRNLVRLVGFCLEGNERLLINEFVPNSSLDHYIYDPVNRADLDWGRRYKIIVGVARGLLYLHEECRLGIIHCDLKPSNILLDNQMNPKIADIGTARFSEKEERQGSTSSITGISGYMAPEYLKQGQLSVKTDVFSFGVMVLEIVMGQRRCFQNGEDMVDLLSYAWENWQERGGLNLIDPILWSSSSPIREIMRCIHIGLLCVHENVADRPSLSSVLSMLNSFSITLPVPSRAGESSEWENVFTEVLSNTTSITELYPR